MHWHLLTVSIILPVTTELMGHLLDRESSPKESSTFSVLGEDQVVIAKSGCSANIACLFSGLRHVEADSALALSLVEDSVCFVHGDHGFVHLFKSVLGDLLLIVTLVDNLALLVHHTEALDLVEVRPEAHVVRELVLKQQFTVNFSHGTERTSSVHGQSRRMI